MSFQHCCDRGSERGSSLTGYTLTVALVVVVALGSMTALETSSEDFLASTGDKIGEPRESAQIAASNVQHTYGNTNSAGGGQAPPATTASNTGSSTTTTSQPTTAPTTSAPPTTTAPTTNPPKLTKKATGSTGEAPPPAGDTDVLIRGSYQKKDNIDASKKPKGSSTAMFADDDALNVFSEAMVVLTNPWVVPGTTTPLNAGDSVCGYYVHYTPVSKNAGVSNVSVAFPGAVLSVVGGDKELDDSDEWAHDEFQTPDRYRKSRQLENGEFPEISGNTLTFSLYAARGNQDDARVFTRC